ncbi:MAG: hypothetical protein M1829_001582 [Trizodia sp. TS-e1964]|nr:MAG: hypothetical protein M1829_001582 [Trizodia sp. TS-e1964]
MSGGPSAGVFIQLGLISIAILFAPVILLYIWRLLFRWNPWNLFRNPVEVDGPEAIPQRKRYFIWKWQSASNHTAHEDVFSRSWAPRGDSCSADSQVGLVSTEKCGKISRALDIFRSSLAWWTFQKKRTSISENGDEEKGFQEDFSVQAGTVHRQLTADSASPPAWQSGSTETDRATKSQLLINKRQAEEGLQAEPNDPAAIREWPSGILTEHRTHNIESNLDDLAHAEGARRYPKVIRYYSSIHPLASQRHSPTDGPPAPENSEDLAMAAQDSNQLAKGRQNGSITSESEEKLRKLSCESHFTNNLTHQLELWASPMTLDPYVSCGPAGVGIAGRCNSPAMGWTIFEKGSSRGEKLNTTFDGASSHEGEALSLSEYEDYDLELNIHNNSPSLSRARVPEWRGWSKIRTYSQQIKKPKLDRTLQTVVRRSSAFPGKTQIQDYKIMTGHLSAPEARFLTRLDRSLSWLEYELSGGFRGPKDNTTEYFSPYLIHRGNDINSLRKVPSIGPGGGEAGKLALPRIDSWRDDMDRFRKEEGVEALSPPSMQSGAEVIGNTEVDTAAWVLRRPPQNIGLVGESQNPTDDRHSHL